MPVMHLQTFPCDVSRVNQHLITTIDTILCMELTRKRQLCPSERIHSISSKLPVPELAGHPHYATSKENWNEEVGRRKYFVYQNSSCKSQMKTLFLYPVTFKSKCAKNQIICTLFSQVDMIYFYFYKYSHYQYNLITCNNFVWNNLYILFLVGFNE